MSAGRNKEIKPYRLEVFKTIPRLIAFCQHDLLVQNIELLWSIPPIPTLRCQHETFQPQSFLTTTICFISLYSNTASLTIKWNY